MTPATFNPAFDTVTLFVFRRSIREFTCEEVWKKAVDISNQFSFKQIQLLFIHRKFAILAVISSKPRGPSDFLSRQSGGMIKKLLNACLEFTILEQCSVQPKCKGTCKLDLPQP